MRKALIVGIDHYVSGSQLSGCVDDAHAVKAVLERHADGTKNFGVKILAGNSEEEAVNRQEIMEALRDLFSADVEIALFYFSGHGYADALGGFLCASDSRTGDDGISLGDIMTLANASPAGNKIILLDSCHSGIAGNRPASASVAELKSGLTILTASKENEYALEGNKGGIFTSLLIDALEGAAGNLMGDVTPGSVYAHIDQSLGAWEQRPVFKTNVTAFVSLREVQPPIALADLQQISLHFPSPKNEYPLDPSFEPEGPNPDPKNTAVFAVLQKYNRVNLVVPVDAPHMYHAAMGSKSCKLTVLGEHYRRLVECGQI